MACYFLPKVVQGLSHKVPENWAAHSEAVFRSPRKTSGVFTPYRDEG